VSEVKSLDHASDASTDDHCSRDQQALGLVRGQCGPKRSDPTLSGGESSESGPVALSTPTIYATAPLNGSDSTQVRERRADRAGGYFGTWVFAVAAGDRTRGIDRSHRSRDRRPVSSFGSAPRALVSDPCRRLSSEVLSVAAVRLAMRPVSYTIVSVCYGQLHSGPAGPQSSRRTAGQMIDDQSTSSVRTLCARG